MTRSKQQVFRNLTDSKRFVSIRHCYFRSFVHIYQIKKISQFYLKLIYEDPQRLSKDTVARSCSVKKVFLKISQNSQEKTCPRASFLIKLQVEASNFIKKETLAQVFSCEFCEILKNKFL